MVYGKRVIAMIKETNVSKLSEVIALVENSIDVSKGPRWFRGVGEYPLHRLEPTLLRHKDVKTGHIDPLTLEQRLKTRFLQTSPPFLSNIPRACPRFCVNGLMAGNCQSSQRKRNDRKQRTDRPPVGGLQKT